MANKQKQQKKATKASGSKSDGPRVKISKVSSLSQSAKSSAKSSAKPPIQKSNRQAAQLSHSSKPLSQLTQPSIKESVKISKASSPSRSSQSVEVAGTPGKVLRPPRPTLLSSFSSAPAATSSSPPRVSKGKSSREAAHPPSSSSAAGASGVSGGAQSWSDYRAKFIKMKPLEYKMSSQYSGSGPLLHPVLGWGYILSIQNDRLEVLFENGKKNLISNYKKS